MCVWGIQALFLWVQLGHAANGVVLKSTDSVVSARSSDKLKVVLFGVTTLCLCLCVCVCVRVCVCVCVCGCVGVCVCV